MSDNCPAKCNGIDLGDGFFSGCNCSGPGCDCPNHPAAAPLSTGGRDDEWEPHDFRVDVEAARAHAADVAKLRAERDESEAKRRGLEQTIAGMQVDAECAQAEIAKLRVERGELKRHAAELADQIVSHGVLLEHHQARADAAESSLSRAREALERYTYVSRCEGIGAQSWHCRECTVTVHGPRPGKRPDPFPHAVGCALSTTSVTRDQ